MYKHKLHHSGLYCNFHSDASRGQNFKDVKVFITCSAMHFVKFLQVEDSQKGRGGNDCEQLGSGTKCPSPPSHLYQTSSLYTFNLMKWEGGGGDERELGVGIVVFHDKRSQITINDFLCIDFVSIQAVTFDFINGQEPAINPFTKLFFSSFHAKCNDSVGLKTIRVSLEYACIILAGRARHASSLCTYKVAK